MSVVEALGFCVGVVGLSLGDFMVLTPAECDAVCKAYNDRVEREGRMAWERSRVMAYASVSPYFGKGRRLSPQKFLPLPWDGARRSANSVGSDLSGDGNRAAIARLAGLCG